MKKIAIYDRDISYAFKLMKYFSSRQEVPFRTIVFTGKEQLSEFLDNNIVHILMISADDADAFMKCSNVKCIILMLDRNDGCKEGDFQYIYKYQSAESILRKIIDSFLEINDGYESNAFRGNCARIIGVYSPVKRVGKTTFSVALGRAMARDSTVLFISLEEFSPIGKMFCPEYLGDISDLMYLYLQNPKTAVVKLQTIVNRIDEMDYILPIQFMEDLRNISVDKWIELLGTLGTDAGYDIIIIDIGDMVGNVFNLLDLCNRIYMPVLTDYTAELKVKAFEEYLLRGNHENILEKITKIQLPATDLEQIPDTSLESPIGRYALELVQREEM